MLRLADSQLERLGQKAYEDFLGRTRGVVAETWPEEVEMLGAERASKAVSAAVDAALEHGFRTEFDVGRYVHLAFAFRSLAFVKNAWATEVMEQSLPPRFRMNQLFERATAVLQEQGAR